MRLPNARRHGIQARSKENFTSWPGLIAVEHINLSGEGLSAVWDPPISVPRGCWLARGDVTRAKSLAASLLTFYPKSDLSAGEMEVRPVTHSGDLHFNVYVSEQLYPQCKVRRDLQIAALIAALGRIPHLDPANDPEVDDDSSQFSALTSIRERLIEQNVPVWGDGQNDHFDPARAATAIEQFLVDPVYGQH